MRRPLLRPCTAALALALVAGIAAAAGSAPRYSAENLGNLDVGLAGQTIGLALNTGAQIAGHAHDAQGRRSGVLTAAQGRDGHALASLGGTSTIALALNDAGRAVGTSTLAGDAVTRAFATASDGVSVIDLGTFGGRDARASGINNAGEIVGGAQNANRLTLPFITDADTGGLRAIELPPGYVAGSAEDVNERGQAVGALLASTGGWRAFITGPHGVGVTTLATRSGEDGAATAVNRFGNVVGNATDSLGRYHAFVTGPQGRHLAPVVDPDARQSFLADINDAGQAVGHDYSPEGTLYRAVVTAPGKRTLVVLDDLVDLPGGVRLRAASAINAVGQIVATGSDGAVYLLTPLPR